MRDDFTIKKDFQSSFKACISCNTKTDHLIDDCPFLRYKPRKDTIIQRHLHFNPNSRNRDFKRKTRLKSDTHALKNNVRLKSALEKQNCNKLEHFLKMQSAKKSIITSSMDEEENLSFFEIEENEKDTGKQWKKACNSCENIKKEEEKEFGENEKEFSSHDNIMITFKRENSRSRYKEEFERGFIGQFELKKKILLNCRNIERMGAELFDFEFEQAQNYRIYHKSKNYDKVIREYRKSRKMKNKR